MTRSTRYMAALLAGLTGLGASATAHASPVAFVEAGAGMKDLAAAIRVKRGARQVPVKGRYLNLEAGDEITLRAPGAKVAVRYLGDNAVHWVRRQPGAGKGAPDYRVRVPQVPSLPQAVFDWLAAQVVGGGAARPQQEITASSRTTRGGEACAATVDGSAAALQFRGAPAGAAKVAAGAEPLVVAWVGGTGPYAVQAVSDGGAAVAGALRGCHARIEGKALAPGRYTLTLRDGSGAAPVRLPVAVEAARPAMPEVLAKAAIDPVARQLYYATWLSGVEGGAWALEAQRIVLSQDCRAPGVKDWLGTAGLRSACDLGEPGATGPARRDGR